MTDIHPRLAATPLDCIEAAANLAEFLARHRAGLAPEIAADLDAELLTLLGEAKRCVRDAEDRWNRAVPPTVRATLERVIARLESFGREMQQLEQLADPQVRDSLFAREVQRRAGEVRGCATILRYTADSSSFAHPALPKAA